MSRRVLVIDDDPDVLGFVKRSLEAEGFEVRTAGSGRAGLDAATAAPPDLVLLDLSLPDADGYEVLRKLPGRPVSGDNSRNDLERRSTDPTRAMSSSMANGLVT
jgi:CheY-like chemotaxis protein